MCSAPRLGKFWFVLVVWCSCVCLTSRNVSCQLMWCIGFYNNMWLCCGLIRLDILKDSRTEEESSPCRLFTPLMTDSRWGHTPLLKWQRAESVKDWVLWDSGSNWPCHETVFPLWPQSTTNRSTALTNGWSQITGEHSGVSAHVCSCQPFPVQHHLEIIPGCQQSLIRNSPRCKHASLLCPAGRWLHC